MHCDSHGWLTIVRQLSERSTGLPKPSLEGNSAGTPPHPGHVDVKLVERLTSRTAAITWHEPGVCHYVEQTWIAGVSRGSGLCALTGKTLSSGDPVYRPRQTRPPSHNAAAMIAADQILKLPKTWTEERQLGMEPK